jgi:hypothetical protein
VATGPARGGGQKPLGETLARRGWGVCGRGDVSLTLYRRCSFLLGWAGGPTGAGRYGAVAKPSLGRRSVWVVGGARAVSHWRAQADRREARRDMRSVRRCMAVERERVVGGGVGEWGDLLQRLLPRGQLGAPKADHVTTKARKKERQTIHKFKLANVYMNTIHHSSAGRAFGC